MTWASTSYRFVIVDSMHSANNCRITIFLPPCAVRFIRPHSYLTYLVISISMCSCSPLTDTQKMLQYDPANRVSAEQALQPPYGADLMKAT